MKVDDVVHLHSGGFNMVITHIDTSNGQVTCQWFEGTKLNTEIFQASDLVVLHCYS